jgi:hypothetical protein
MPRLSSSVVLTSAFGFISALVIAAGCASTSTDDGGDPIIAKDAGPAATGTGAKLPPSSSGGTSTSSSTGGTTSGGPAGDDDDVIGGPDGGADADAGPPAPPPPNEGDPCTQQDQILTAACGFCGTKTTVCVKKDDNSLAWSGYSPCQGEHGECAAGATGQEACNNCGTRAVTCSTSCKWTPGTCSAPANQGCAPMTFDVVNAGCGADQTGLYRVRQCNATCSYGNYSGCEAPPTTIEVGPSVGAVSSTVTVLGGSIPRLSTNSCPGNPSSTISSAYAYTQVHNPLAKDVTVIIYNSQAPAGTVFNTAIAVYNGDTAPVTPDQRKACVKASNIGNSSITGDAKFASTDGTNKIVTIPAGGIVTVYSAATNATDQGAVRVNAKTNTIAN